MLYPIGISLIFWILAQICSTQCGAKSLKLCICSDCNGQVAIRSRKNFIGNDIGVSVAKPLRRVSGCKVIVGNICQLPHLGIEQCDVYVLALAGLFAMK